MCRRSHLQGCCLVLFGLGLMVGHYLDSWLLCAAGGFCLVVLGLMVFRKR